MGQPLLIFAPYLQCPFGVQKDLHGERAKRASLRMDGMDGMGWMDGMGRNIKSVLQCSSYFVGI